MDDIDALVFLLTALVASAAFGWIFAIRVGGADMPITISLLNSLSGVAAAIAGFAVSDILLVSIGGIVGASGLFLTQVMCRAMNRSLSDILLGRTALQGRVAVNRPEQLVAGSGQVVAETGSGQLDAGAESWPEAAEKLSAGGGDEAVSDDTGGKVDVTGLINGAKKVIIVPGYGMALAHAQHLVKQLALKLKGRGAEVRYAIHPVAGRMPGHMDVLLIEAGVPFEDVYEMADINDEFRDADLTIVVGANDVMNPSARDAKGTPIYGMPILNVDECRNVLIFNYDLQPGYSGVENPLYSRKEGVTIIEGDAAETLAGVLGKIDGSGQ